MKPCRKITISTLEQRKMPIQTYIKTSFPLLNSQEAHLLLQLKQALPRLLTEQEALSDFVAAQQAGLKAFATDQIPYYQQNALVHGETLEPWPTLKKKHLQQHFLDLWHDGSVGDERLKHWQTSGSTGQPTRFVVDAFSIEARELGFWLVQYLAHPNLETADWLWQEVEQNKPLMLRLSSYEAGEPWTKTMPLFGGRTLTKMSALNHAECDLSQPAKFLLENQPPFLGGDPQSYLALMDFWEATQPNGYSALKELYLLKTLTCGGDQLLPEVRSRMETFFGVPVTDVYAMSEVGILASKCHRGELHVHTPFNVLEAVNLDSVDEAGLAIPDGDVGNLLVTHLTNTAMPLIRYETGDRGRLDTTSNCPCGVTLPILITLEGRRRQQFLNAQGEFCEPYALSKPLFELHINQFQWIQQDTHILTLNYVRQALLSNEEKEQITGVASALLVTPQTIRFQQKARLQEPGQKLQCFLCEIT
jgi:phenylacetate-coenzyme A ligase PaaK-like adenylate-forming protein